MTEKGNLRAKAKLDEVMASQRAISKQIADLKRRSLLRKPGWSEASRVM